ncbi:MAG TPA: TetR/AcrR family transcriptional regulator [Acidimicrobiales bacterium]|nr:TetR/AcrR family transcriptional regulator [Acidimicrobiales bacterium]
MAGRPSVSGNGSTDDTVRSILSAARQLFHSPGYASTPVSTIARRAGVSRATVYNHFPDKRSILNTIVREYMAGYEQIGMHLRMRLEPKESLYDLLRSMVRDAMLWRIDNADLRPAIEVAKQQPDGGWREADDAADRAMHDWLASVHHAGRERGLTRPDVDIDFASGALYSMIEASLSALNPAASRQEVEQITDQLALLQWHAIYTIPPAESPLVEDVLPFPFS